MTGTGRDVEPPAPSGMKTVTRVLLWQLAVLGLYMVPALTIVVTSAGSGALSQTSELLVMLGFFGPVIQSGLSLLSGLIMMIATRHKNAGAGLMLSGVVVGMIGLTVCVGLLVASY